MNESGKKTCTRTEILIVEVDRYSSEEICHIDYIFSILETQILFFKIKIIFYIIFNFTIENLFLK